MSTCTSNELDKDGTAVCRTVGFNKRKITNNINFLKAPDVQFPNYRSMHVFPLCVLQLNYLSQKSRPHRACLFPHQAAYIFSICLGFYRGEYNTQLETVYHIWSAGPSFFQLTVLFILWRRQVGQRVASQGFAVQLPCTHPSLLHNIPGKKIPGYNPRQSGCKMGAIFWSDDPVSVSGLLSPCTIENIKDSPNHCPSLQFLHWSSPGGSWEAQQSPLMSLRFFTPPAM